jgi:hypothetical protein
MSLSSQEAQASLAQAESARRRSAQLYGYSKAAPHLIMWGVIWVVGYSSTALFDGIVDWNWIWALLMIAGAGGGIFINRRICQDGLRGDFAWRHAAIMGIAVLFVFLTYLIMWPVHGKVLATYPVLITGCAYMGAGLWAGLRYVLTGAAVVALALIGFYFVEPILYWMAFVGGGSMILAGFWFRTV